MARPLCLSGAGAWSPRFTGQAAWRGLVPAAAVEGAGLAEGGSVFLGPGRHLVAYPLADGTVWNIVAVEARRAWTEEGWSTPADPDDVRRAFAGWCGPVTRLLGALEQTFLWGLFSHPPLPRWHAGRVALLGDACHPMLPFLAQGATMALEDAWVLASALDRTADVGHAFAHYEAQRKPRTTRVQQQSARNAWIYHAWPPASWAAAAGMATVSRLPGGGLARPFDWLYGADVTASSAP